MLVKTQMEHNIVSQIIVSYRDEMVVFNKKVEFILRLRQQIKNNIFFLGIFNAVIHFY